jgi:hypothetical protein
MTTHAVHDATPPQETDGVAQLAAYCRKLEAQRRAETDPLQRQSLGMTIALVRGELFRVTRCVGARKETR